MFKLAVIVLNYNTLDITSSCLASLFAASPEKYNSQIVVVDNASHDDSAKTLKKRYPKIDLIVNKDNFGFAAGNNVGAKKYYKKAERVMFLNSDTLVGKDFFKTLTTDGKLLNFALFSPKLKNKDNSLQPNSGNLPTPVNVLWWLTGLDDLLGKFIVPPSYQNRRKDYYQGTKKVGWVSGTALVVNSKVFKEIGFLDENLFMYGEDVEFCFRAHKQGIGVNWTDKLSVVHLGGASLDRPQYRQWLGEFRGLLYIYQKYYGKLAKITLKTVMYPFIFLRAFAFFLLGRRENAQAYFQILTSF